MQIGYARVSTLDQNLNFQIDQLTAAGCEKIYTETASGAKDRPRLRELLEFARAGDTITVYKIDRLGRSLPDLLQIVAELDLRQINLVSLSDAFDTSTAAGRMFFQIAAAFAEYERNILKERTAAGLAAARERGKVGGRPRAINEQQSAAIRAAFACNPNVRQLAEIFGTSPRTIRRVLNGESGYTAPPD